GHGTADARRFAEAEGHPQGDGRLGRAAGGVARRTSWLSARRPPRVQRAAIVCTSMRKAGFTSRLTMRSVLGGHLPWANIVGKWRLRQSMNLAMSGASTRYVVNCTTLPQPMPADCSAAAMLAKT